MGRIVVQSPVFNMAALEIPLSDNLQEGGLPRPIAATCTQEKRIRQEIVNREIKTNLTQILLEVTDTLFGEPPRLW